MAKMTNEGILGPLSGKIGPVVGASWKGIPYLRSLPSKRKGKISEKEQANRDKFKMAQLWLKPLTGFVRVGFKNYSPTVFGFNAAKSWLLKNAMEVTEAGIVINPSRMLVSYGDLPLPANIRLGNLENEKLNIHWDVDPKDYTYKFDQCMLLAYNIEKGFDLPSLNGQFRHVGSDSIMIPARIDNTYHIYTAFIAADRSRVSNSVYLGSVNT